MLPRPTGRKGRPFADARLMVEGIVCRYRTVIAWRDLPAVFGPWQTVWTWFRRANRGKHGHALAIARNTGKASPARDSRNARLGAHSSSELRSKHWRSLRVSGALREARRSPGCTASPRVIQTGDQTAGGLLIQIPASSVHTQPVEDPRVASRRPRDVPLVDDDCTCATQPLVVRTVKEPRRWNRSSQRRKVRRARGPWSMRSTACTAPSRSAG